MDAFPKPPLSTPSIRAPVPSTHNMSLGAVSPRRSSFETFPNSNADQKWSSILQFPIVNSSLFDANGTKALEVTISPTSIFQSQTGFRRSELMPSSNSGTDLSTTGVKTIHFSVQKDTLKPLNSSHEYQLFFLESNDYSTNQVVLKYGSIIGGNPNGVDKDSLMVVGNVNSKPIPLLYSTKFTPGVWHNFGITLNFNAGKAVKNDVSGQGEYHFGILKKPTGGGSDITKSGFQEGGINEGVIFGGIFEEDSSATGCISLKP
ncbi:related to endoglucanase c [Phialocephala subalpina]|uniref:Related to endoglucanase c n=1 Tax=Phialocephala subalpina TaxID=576137 RepID=A0A1L7XUM9_9HELO|nr:related to endoglucanase c [Phialocephala subalpina]